MVKSILISIPLLLILACFTFVENQSTADEEYPFQPGEELYFKVKYGWFTIGKAKISILSDTIVDDRESFNVFVEARSAGLLGFFNSTVDQFTGVVTKDGFEPIIAYQNFMESNKREIQTNTYDYENLEVTVERTNYEGVDLEPEVHQLDSGAYDIISSYLYLRSIAGKPMNVEDSVMINVFYGEKHYNFGIEYGGKEEIRSKIGRIQTQKYYILFPISSSFPEARSVMVWATADKNMLPVKIQAKLKFGNVYCDLTDYSNIKYPISN